MSDGQSDYSNIRPFEVPPGEAAEFITQKQSEDQIRVQQQQAAAGGSNPGTEQNK